MLEALEKLPGAFLSEDLLPSKGKKTSLPYNSDCQDFAIEIAKQMNLNEDQEKVLKSVAGWFGRGEEREKSFNLVHGVFGSGKKSSHIFYFTSFKKRKIDVVDGCSFNAGQSYGKCR